ncbi:membrane protein [Motilibacter rhizosphaerae]|uniref:Membrane protein n=1 Tax=Motilibacter rhizosphaerae TaxID=598652 RepID=A0A4Q7NTF1_9ACTN|nr:YihY/virulence factor BrkB family protein [Motilibacter rhizosphaerae]RZS90284.1 membrane protein [Motilibacter rhizosphaerae]
MPAVVSSAKDAVTEVRTRAPVVDHVLRMNKHYGTVRGGQLAGAVTYFGFLSFFPLVAVAFSVIGYVSDAYPDAKANLTSSINSTFPGLIGTDPGKINLDTISSAKAGVGIIGLVTLLLSGLAWLDALREALRQMWGLAPEKANVVVKKVTDVFVLVVLGGLVLVSTALSSFATSFSETALGWVGLQGNTWALLALKVLGTVIALAGDAVVLVFVFSRLPGHKLPWRNVLHGAVLGAVVIEILKLLGTYLVGKTTSNALYGAFAIIIGLLVWINFICRAVMYSAAWAVTGPKPTLEALTVAEDDVLDPEEAKAVSGKALPTAHVSLLRVRAERRSAEQKALRKRQAAVQAEAKRRFYAFFGVLALVAVRLGRRGDGTSRR